MFAVDTRSSRNSSNRGSGTSKLPIVGFLVAVFLALMNLKLLPVNAESPFESHLVIMSMFIITILVYTITLCTPYFPEIIGSISLLSGSLGPVLLALILLPGLGWSLLLIWILYFAKLTYDACQKLYQLYDGTSVFDISCEQLVSHLFRALHEEPTIAITSSDGPSTAENRRHQILGFPITVLLALMPLRFHSVNIAVPFETHSAVMSIFVITTLVYVIARATEAKLQIGNHRHIISKISLLSGSLATVLLVLVIAPALGRFVLLVWTLFLVKVIYDACRDLQQLYQALLLAFRRLDELFGLGGHQNGPGSRLPV